MQITSSTHQAVGTSKTTESTAVQQSQKTEKDVALSVSQGDTVTLSAEGLALAETENSIGSGSGNEPPATETLGSGSGNEPPAQTTLGSGSGNEPPKK